MAKIPANILKMALDPLADSAQAIVRNVSDITADKVGALTRMADDVVDDWGWKGGKPGEITGNDFERITEALEYDERDISKNPEELSKLYSSIEKQFGKSSNQYFRNIAYSGDRYNMAKTMASFKNLEDAGIPREWTGKVLPAVQTGWLDYPTDVISRLDAKTFSSLLSNLSNPQKETFLSLLPEWEGSLDDLAVVARSLA